MRRPLELRRARKREVRGERVAHRLHDAVGPPRLEVVVPPEAEHLHGAGGTVDPWLDAPDEALAEEDRQHVPAEAALLGREEELPDVVEAEQRAEQRAVPDQRVE